jgi:hypothetical protein|tara:strand:- start:51 stop:686 length:636 start_codon:yes stop_codon:yes gene_type:complete
MNMIDIIDELKILILLFASGLSLRFALTLTGQNWAKTYQQTVAYLVLPFITYIITKTIAGNVALSLGMIGAMSIVRFRNPVKSPLELIMFFALITIGIAANVQIKSAILLVLVIISILIGVKLVQVVFKRYNKSFYNISFNEGVSQHMIEIHSSKRIDIIEKNPNIKNIISLPGQNDFLYRLAYENKKQLNILKEQLDKIEDIKKIDINYV